MKAIVGDVDILSHLETQKVEAYLQATGWRERDRLARIYYAGTTALKV